MRHNVNNFAAAAPRRGVKSLQLPPSLTLPLKEWCVANRPLNPTKFKVVSRFGDVTRLKNHKLRAKVPET